MSRESSSSSVREIQNPSFLFHGLNHPLSRSRVAAYMDTGGCSLNGAREFLVVIMHPKNKQKDLLYAGASSDMRTDYRGVPYFLLIDVRLTDEQFEVYRRWKTFCLKRHSMDSIKVPMVPVVSEEAEIMRHVSEILSCGYLWGEDEGEVEDWTDVFPINGHISSLYVRNLLDRETVTQEVVDYFAQLPCLRWLHLCAFFYPPVSLAPLGSQLSRLTIYFHARRTDPMLFDSLSTLTNLRFFQYMCLFIYLFFFSHLFVLFLSFF